MQTLRSGRARRQRGRTGVIPLERDSRSFSLGEKKIGVVNVRTLELIVENAHDGNNGNGGLRLEQKLTRYVFFDHQGFNMCIFTQPVESVNNTRIFARTSSRHSQFLVYQMNYESPDDNAMILPIPVRQPVREDSLRFIDLKAYDHFFDDLVGGFPFTPQFHPGCSASSNPNLRRDLEVFTVGNYIASFVPNMVDFSRLDRQFTLPESTWSQIPQYANYGFAVFQLAAGSLKPHPIAFEFESSRDSIYFPTMHIHDGAIHEKEEFDHVLYLQHAGFDSRVYGYQNSHVPDQSTGLIRSKYVAGHFCDTIRAQGIVAPELLVHRRIIRGNHTNQDTEIATSGDPTTPALNLRPLVPFLPWLVIAAVTMWFFRRCAKIKQLKTSNQGKPANAG